MLRLIINAPNGSNVVTIFNFYFTSVAKKLAVVKSIFWQLGMSFSGLKQESTFGLSTGTKMSSRFREVAVGAGSMVVRNKMPV